MPDFTLRQNDTLPVITDTIVDQTGAPLNLTGATVRFKMRSRATNLLVLNVLATITDTVNGKVAYAWQAADTAVAGTYDGKFEVTFSDNSRISDPNNKNWEILIFTDID